MHTKVLEINVTVIINIYIYIYRHIYIYINIIYSIWIQVSFTVSESPFNS